MSVYDPKQALPLIRARDDLVDALTELNNILLEERPATWLPFEWLKPPHSTIEQAANHIVRLSYLKEQESNTTTMLPGIIIANNAIKNAIMLVNQHKDYFASVLAQTKKNNSQEHFFKIKANVLDFKRWNIKQALRKIHVIEEEVKSTSFNWVHNDKIIKKINSHEELNTWVSTHFISEDTRMDALIYLSGFSVSKLSIIRPVPTYLSSSFRFYETDLNTPKPKKIKIHSPVFLTNNQDLPIPKKEPRILPEPTKRLKRNDARQRSAVFDGMNLFVET